MAFEIKYIYQLVDKISPKIEKIKRNIDASARGVRAAAAKMGRAFDGVANKLDNLGRKSLAIGKSLALRTTLPIALLGASFIKVASDYEESINKVDVAFGKAGAGVKKFAANAGQNFGIDRGAALEMAALFGDMGTGMGFAQDKAAEMSTSLVGLSGDISSFKNISIGQTQTALKSIFTGETESLKNLGIVMTETNLKEFARSKGISQSLKTMKQAEKVMLRYNFVMAMSKNAIGDYKRTLEGFANQQRGLGVAWKQLSITMGTIMLPIVTKLVKKISQLVNWFEKLSPRVHKTILIVAGLVAIIAPLLLGFGLIAIALGASIKAFAAFNAIILANPLVRFIALLAVLYASWEDFRIVVNFLGSALANVFQTDAMSGFIDQLKSVLGWLNKILKVSKFFTGLFANAKLILDTGIDKITQTLDDKAGINRKDFFQPINTSENKITAGGQMDINLRGFPKGTSANMTPVPNSFLETNVGMNPVVGGAR